MVCRTLICRRPFSTSLTTDWVPSSAARSVCFRHAVLFHEQTQNLSGVDIRQRIVLAFIVFDQLLQQFEHVGQCVFFVDAHHVEQLVHELDSAFMVGLGVNRSQAQRQRTLKSVPGRSKRLGIEGNGGHFLRPI
jgi:hypothetical protein